MIVLSQTTKIEWKIRVETSFGYTHMSVEIDDSQIIFRANGLMTEVTIKHALQNPAFIKNAIITVSSSILVEEAEELTRKIMFNLR